MADSERRPVKRGSTAGSFIRAAPSQSSIHKETLPKSPLTSSNVEKTVSASETAAPYPLEHTSEEKDEPQVKKKNTRKRGRISSDENDEEYDPNEESSDHKKNEKAKPPVKKKANGKRRRISSDEDDGEVSESDKGKIGKSK